MRMMKIAQLTSYFVVYTEYSWVIKSRRIKWAEYVACTGEVRNAYMLVAKCDRKKSNYRS
jgi:hypothetical protein